MKKRITDNTCDHGFEINQIVKVDRINSDGTRSYMTDSGMIIPERDFDCYEG